MKKVLAFFAEGTEEIECLMVVDILRRAGVSVELIAVAPDKLVKGSHQITVLCDKNISELTENDFSSADLLFLPGGIPGVPHLEKIKSCWKLCKSSSKQERIWPQSVQPPAFSGVWDF